MKKTTILILALALFSALAYSQDISINKKTDHTVFINGLEVLSEIADLEIEIRNNRLIKQHLAVHEDFTLFDHSEKVNVGGIDTETWIFDGSNGGVFFVNTRQDGDEDHTYVIYLDTKKNQMDVCISSWLSDYMDPMEMALPFLRHYIKLKEIKSGK